MKKRTDIEEIASTVDFENVSRKLETLAESGQLRRRKTVTDLLDKVRPGLLRARENKVPFGALAAFLKDSGIPVSQTTLRAYMNALPNAKKTRKRRRAAVARKPGPTAELSKKKLPPRLARRATL